MKDYNEFLEEKLLQLRKMLLSKYKIGENIDEKFIYIKNEKYIIDNKTKQVKWIIKERDLHDKNKFIEIFNKLCEEGKYWINIHYIGQYEDKYNIIEYDYPEQSSDIEYPNVQIGISLNKVIVIDKY